MAKALELAETISSKSPVAVQGTKLHMNYSRGRSVQEGLEYMVSNTRSLARVIKWYNFMRTVMYLNYSFLYTATVSKLNISKQI